MLKFIKNWTLPLAMLIGVVFYPLFSRLAVLTPPLIFSMLLLTFCKVSPRDLKFEPLHFWLLVIQIGGSLLVYGAIAYYNPTVAEGTMICILAPTATAAAVVTGMLGGSVASLTTYTLVSNIGTAIAAPIIFPLIRDIQDLSFWGSFLLILRQVIPLLIFPFFCAWLLQKYVPRVHRKLLNLHQLAFYLWAVALAIVTGKTIEFLVNQETPGYTDEIMIAVSSLVVCCLQFYIGKTIGSRYGNRITGGQALGQKNTILAIWMAQVYLNPIASVGPASYVLWQNIINSWQLWKKRKKETV